jgi:predicted RNase H-like HicB family nuclease
MRTISVAYHREDGHWWADSSDLPGYTALASDFNELRLLVAEGIPFFLDELNPQIIEFLDGAILTNSYVVPTTAKEWFVGNVSTAMYPLASVSARFSASGTSVRAAELVA